MEPVGTMVKPPDFIGTLSGLMHLKQQKQALDTGAAELQMKQQDASQRTALAKVEWDKYMGEDGTLDLNKLVADKDTLQSLGDSAPQVMQSALHIKGAQLQNMDSLRKLTDEQRGTWASIAGGLKDDPDVKAGSPEGQQKIKDAYTQFAQTYGMEAARAVAPFALPVVNNQVPPNKLSSMLQHVQLQAMDVQRQLEMTKSQPQSMTTPNGDMQLFETNPYAPGGVGANIGAPKPQGVAPFAGTAPNSQPGTFSNGGRTFTPATTSPSSDQSIPKQSSGFYNQDGSHRTAMQDAPPPTAPAATQENYSKSVTTANDHVQHVRDADEHYRTNVDISNKIRDLSRTTMTGPAMAWIKDKVGASDFQELGAYLDRQAAGLQTAMNLPHTNQGQEAARDISGNTRYTPKAIQEKNDFNQSLVEGFHAYRKGLEHVGGLSGNGSPIAINQFKSAWAEYFDPNVFRAKAAYERSTDEGKSFIKSLSPQDAEKMLRDKKALDALSQGKMPE